MLVIPFPPNGAKVNDMKLLRIALATSLLFAGSILVMQTSSAQQSTSQISIPGLRDRVTVRRDERGIPYIEAANDEDLFLAQGYVTASDRLWQMDLMRRNVRGELAEIFGQNALAEDKRHRTLGFGTVVDETAKNLPPNLKLAMDA